MVTVEAALVFPTALLLFGTALWGGAGLWAQLRCSAAAQLGAQAVADGASLPAVRELVSADAPPGSVLVTSVTGTVVRLSVTWGQPDRMGGLFSLLPPIEASATEQAYRPG
jgi:hypothetical protein